MEAARARRLNEIENVLKERSRKFGRVVLSNEVDEGVALDLRTKETHQGDRSAFEMLAVDGACRDDRAGRAVIETDELGD